MALTHLCKPPSFGVAHVTLESVILACDDVYAGFLGVTVHDAVGRRVSDFTSEEAGGGPETMISIVVRTGEPMAVRRTFAHAGGIRVTCNIQLCLVRDAEGLPHSIVGVAQLITRNAP